MLFFAARRGFLVLDRAWLMSLAKFLLTGIILAASFWLIARFSGSAFASMHLHDELRLVLLAVGGTIVHALAISSCWPQLACLARARLGKQVLAPRMQRTSAHLLILRDWRAKRAA
ncbi:hypothetical protein [Bradyrhizobium sp. ERR14]|uniref:hypothetical protein n=1 Tax=Bradyrhizobium sp. ERR14 TaxID=2663837 RepID=UPI0017E9018D|nr:hypothetical protein [Bradyrhizobium sp. ERR14]MBB4392633.1 hypothetical protein [Bradyrhizobium sp. ERR14]